MRALQLLLAEHWSDGVEFVTVEDVASLYGGLTGKTREDFQQGSGRYVPYVNVFNNPGVDLSSTKPVRLAPGERQNLVRAGDVLFTTSSENREEVGMSSVVMDDPEEDIVLNSFCFGVHWNEPLLEQHFAKHLFRSRGVRDQIVRTASGVTRFNISKAEFRKVSFPVPPRAVQRRIAAILEESERLATELAAELAAELSGRQRQYEFYRHALLSGTDLGGTDGVLSDFLEMKAGKFISSSEVSAERTDARPYPCYGGGGLRGYVANPSHEGSRSLIGRQGALCGKVTLAEGPFYATEHAVVVTPKAGLDQAWIRHKLTEMNLNQYATKSAQPGLSVKVLANLPVHVPSLVEQERSARALTRLHALTGDLTVGIAAEIAARRKQYEYYRDLLLTFPVRTA